MGLLDQGASDFRYTMLFSRTSMGRSNTSTTAFTVSWKMSDWLFLEGSLPMVENYYSSGPGYDIAGVGDATLFGYVNLSTTLFGMGKKSDSDNSSGSIPVFQFGGGSKLATGRNTVQDDLGNVIPAYYQPGTGMQDYYLLMSYYQEFGKFTPNASVSYTMTGPINDQLYERSDRVSLSAGFRYSIDEKRGGAATFSFILTNVFDNDSFNSMELSTAGVYTYGQIGYTMQPLNQMDMSLSIQFPLTAPASATTGGANNSAMDYMVALTFGYKF
jgi:hypothetical protein